LELENGLKTQIGKKREEKREGKKEKGEYLELNEDIRPTQAHSKRVQ
jgi:hypothetical protein